MEKTKNISLWTEQGYSLFAEEGLEGIHVERLARILQLNKSGFYHYFGDMEEYYAEIVKLHERKVDHFLQDVAQLKQLDPDYLLLLVRHAPTVMVQVQFARNQNSKSFYQASEVADRKLDSAIQQLWSDYLEVTSSPDLAIRYFSLIRDVFYTRISFQNLNYPYLHNLVIEAKQLVTELAQEQLLQANNVLR